MCVSNWYLIADQTGITSHDPFMFLFWIQCGVVHVRVWSGMFLFLDGLLIMSAATRNYSQSGLQFIVMYLPSMDREPTFHVHGPKHFST